MSKVSLSNLKNYGLFHSFWVLFCLGLTKLLFPGSRLVRFPIFIRGRNRVKLGRGLTTGYFNRIDVFGANALLSFGDRVQINDHCHIAVVERVTIGDDVLIASRVFITDHNHGGYSDTTEHSSPNLAPSIRPLFSRPVVIEERVWLGEGVVVLSGVTIGAGCVIGAGSVVTQNIPAECIAIGVPARVVSRFDHESATWKKIFQ